MKNWSFAALIMLMLSLPGWAHAQAPYTGGTHDGYAKYNFALISEKPYGASPVGISPNPVALGNRLDIHANDVRDKVDIRLYTLMGQSLRRKVAWGISGNYTTFLNIDRLAAGIYLLKVIVDGKVYPQKIVVTAP